MVSRVRTPKRTRSGRPAVGTRIGTAPKNGYRPKGVKKVTVRPRSGPTPKTVPPNLPTKPDKGVQGLLQQRPTKKRKPIDPKALPGGGTTVNPGRPTRRPPKPEVNPGTAPKRPVGRKPSKRPTPSRPTRGIRPSMPIQVLAPDQNQKDLQENHLHVDQVEDLEELDAIRRGMRGQRRRR